MWLIGIYPNDINGKIGFKKIFADCLWIAGIGEASVTLKQKLILRYWKQSEKEVENAFESNMQGRNDCGILISDKRINFCWSHEYVSIKKLLYVRIV